MRAEYNQKNIFVIVWLFFPSIDKRQKLSSSDDRKLLKSPLLFPKDPLIEH